MCVLGKGYAIFAGTAKGVEYFIYYIQPPIEMEEAEPEDSESPYFGPISGKSFYATAGGLKIPAEIFNEYAHLFSDNPRPADYS